MTEGLEKYKLIVKQSLSRLRRQLPLHKGAFYIQTQTIQKPSLVMGAGRKRPSSLLRKRRGDHEVVDE